MKANFVQIIIERDVMTKIPKEARPWEVPIYRSQYGDDKVEILGSIEREVDEDVANPDPGEEYLRLRQTFGIEPDTKQSHADIVYGRGQVGIDALEKAIKAANKGKDAKASVEGAQKVVDTRENPKAKVDEETAAKREDAHRDPLDEEFVEQSNNSIIGAAAGGPGDVTASQEGAIPAPKAGAAVPAPKVR